MTQIIRRALLAFALIAGLGPVFAQAPGPVPALPDTERRTAYTISSSTCACAVNFALYGDSTDYQNWVEVWINGVRVNYNDSTYGWTITSPTGPLANIPRPVTNAVLTFNNPQTGTVQIVGARRPRRVSQFPENRGVAARDLNQALTDIVAQNRETWDKTNDVTGRALLSQPGVTLGLLPVPSACAGRFLSFDSTTGLIPQCMNGAGSGNVVGPPSSVDGDLVFFNGTSGALIKDGGAFLPSSKLPAPFTNGTASGNTSKFATANGTLTAGHCVTIDASGNFVDAGTGCSTSGSIPIFNPTQPPYNAVGDGTTDDTAAFNALCSAVSAAGSGWIWSPPGKTYAVNKNFVASGQVLCGISNVNGLRITMNGSQIVSHYVAQVVFGGTGTTGDTVNWTFSTLVGQPGFPVTISVPMGNGYTPSQMATVTANAINANATLTAASITATANGAAVNINDIGQQVGWYTGNANGNPGLVVTGAKTETMSVVPQYGILIANSQNILIDDFTANAFSGYADSTRNQTGQMSWIMCTASGAASPAFGCRKAQFNGIDLNGCSNSVVMSRVPKTSDYSRNITVNGSVTNCGYGVGAQSDGFLSNWRLTTFNVGRAFIAYNVSGVRAIIQDSRNRDLSLNSVEVGVVGYNGDLSNNTTSDLWVDYKFSLTAGGGTFPTSFINVNHTQGETGTCSIVTHADNLHFNVNITVPSGASSELIEEGTFSGCAGSQTPGEVSGTTELGNTITGVWYGAGGGTSFGCIMSNTGGCSGYGSNLTRGSWTISDFFVPSDTRTWNFGGNLNNVALENYSGLGQALPNVDAASPSLNLVFRAPINFNGTIISGPSCTNSGTVTVLRGAVRSC